MFTLMGLKDSLTHIEGDIGDRALLADAITQARPDIVLHLAAQAIVGRAFTDPYETWRVNALGTVALMDVLRHVNSVKALAVYTTDKVYDNEETGKAYQEHDRIGGLGLYDASKGAKELAVRAFCHSNAAVEGTAIIRAGNVIGGGDWSEGRLVPDCIRRFILHHPVILRHPHSVRPWQHVLDVCHATLQLVQKLYEQPAAYRGAWNIGPEEESVRNVAEVADRLGAIFGIQPAWMQEEGAEKFPEAVLLHLDSGKLKQALGWQPVLSMKDALSMTAEWYKAVLQQGDDVRTCSSAQIRTFQEKLHLQAAVNMV